MEIGETKMVIRMQLSFRDIRGMAFDSSGNLFVSDDGKIKKNII